MKIDVSDHARFVLYDSYSFRSKCRKLLYCKERKWNSPEEFDDILKCDECERQGNTAAVRSALHEIRQSFFRAKRAARQDCSELHCDRDGRIYWDGQRKQFVCPFCGEGYMERIKNRPQKKEDK